MIIADNSGAQKNLSAKNQYHVYVIIVLFMLVILDVLYIDIIPDLVVSISMEKSDMENPSNENTRDASNIICA